MRCVAAEAHYINEVVKQQKPAAVYFLLFSDAHTQRGGLMQLLSSWVFIFEVIVTLLKLNNICARPMSGAVPIAQIKHTCYNSEVYEPSDDSFALVDALLGQLERWKAQPPSRSAALNSAAVSSGFRCYAACTFSGFIAS